MQKLIIITPEDTLKLVDYNGYDTIHEAVDGIYEHFFSDDIPVVNGIGTNGGNSVKCSFFCNEEFLIRDDEQFDKINALATLLSGQEIRGNVALTVDYYNEDGELDSRGFEYLEEDVGDGEIEEAICECWGVEDTLLSTINHNRDKLAQCHRDMDNKKSEPKFEFTSFNF